MCFLYSVPTLLDLVFELEDVYNWIPFGLQLGIQYQELTSIRIEWQTVERCRVEMLKRWLSEESSPTWSAVVQALVGIGRRRHATELVKKR